jgi:hypothetical protein
MYNRSRGISGAVSTRRKHAARFLAMPLELTARNRITYFAILLLHCGHVKKISRTTKSRNTEKLTNGYREQGLESNTAALDSWTAFCEPGRLVGANDHFAE